MTWTSPAWTAWSGWSRRAAAPSAREPRPGVPRRTVTGVIELDEFSRRASRYGGGWLAYLEEPRPSPPPRGEASRTTSDQGRLVAGRAHLQRAVGPPGRGPPEQEPEGQRQVPAGTSSTTGPRSRPARRASTEKAIHRLEAVASDKPRTSVGAAVRDRGGHPQRQVVACLDGAVVDRGAFRLGPVDLEVGWADRVAIVGPNGAGKSTLLDALLGRDRAGRRATAPRARRRGRRDRPGARPLRRRRAAARRVPGGRRDATPRARPGPCWPSSASAPTTSRDRPRRCRRASGPAPASPCCMARA